MNAPRTSNKGYLKVPNDLASRTDLSAAEKFVLAALMGHGRISSEIFPSLEAIAAETGLGEKTVWRAIQKLCRKGEIGLDRPNRAKSNRYFPSPSLAALYGYSGKTASGSNRQNDDSTSRQVGESSKRRTNNNIAKVDILDREIPKTRARKSTSDKAMLVGSIDSVGRTRHNDDSPELPPLMLVASDRLKSYLRTWGLGANTADDLIRTFPEPSIRRQALLLPLRKPKTNPAGYLRRAIAEDYSAPRLSEDQRLWFEEALATQMLPVPDPSQRKASEENLDAWKGDFLAKREADADAFYAERESRRSTVDHDADSVPWESAPDDEEVPF